MGGCRSSALMLQIGQRRFPSDLYLLEVGLSCSKRRFEESTPLPIRSNWGSSLFWPGCTAEPVWSPPPNEDTLAAWPHCGSRGAWGCGSSSGLQQGSATLQGWCLARQGQTSCLPSYWQQQAPEVDAAESLGTCVSVVPSQHQHLGLWAIKGFSNSEPGWALHQHHETKTF